MGFFKNSLESLIEKATSENFVAGSEDLTANLEICDSIQSKQVDSQDALQIIRKRLEHRSPGVHILALKLLDFCAKNGGAAFLHVFASVAFTQYLYQYISSEKCHTSVRDKGLELIQIWGTAFEDYPDLRSMTHLYHNLQADGYKFPPRPFIMPLELFRSSNPPEWKDSPVCVRCRDLFTITVRKHHCRNCGETFCQNCSSKSLPLARFGIEEPVRVCDACFEQLSSKQSSTLNLSEKFNQQSIETKATRPIPTEKAIMSSSNISPGNITKEQEAVQLAIKISLEDVQKANKKLADGNSKVEKHILIEEEEKAQLESAIAASMETAPREMQEETTSMILTNELNDNDMDRIIRFSSNLQRLANPINSDFSEEFHIPEPLRDEFIDIYSYQAKIQKGLNRLKEDYFKLTELESSLRRHIEYYEQIILERPNFQGVGPAVAVNPIYDPNPTSYIYQSKFYSNLNEGQYSFDSIPNQAVVSHMESSQSLYGNPPCCTHISHENSLSEQPLGPQDQPLYLGTQQCSHRIEQLSHLPSAPVGSISEQSVTAEDKPLIEF